MTWAVAYKTPGTARGASTFQEENGVNLTLYVYQVMHLTGPSAGVTGQRY